jgi:hypothetical protein
VPFLSGRVYGLKSADRGWQLQSKHVPQQRRDRKGEKTAPQKIRAMQTEEEIN